MSARTKSRRQRRRAKKIALKTMEHWMKQAVKLGVTNPEIMETLTKNGDVSVQHSKAIKKLRSLQGGNRHNPDGNYNEQRHWEQRQKIIESSTKWLEERGFQWKETA